MSRPPSISQNEAISLLLLADCANLHAPSNPLEWARGFLFAHVLDRGVKLDPRTEPGPGSSPVGRVEVVRASRSENP